MYNFRSLKYFLFLLTILFSTTLFGNSFTPPSLRTREDNRHRNILRGKLTRADKRYGTFLRAFQLMEERGAKILVETGTARGGKLNFRGDGGSTILFSEWVYSHPSSHLYSVDIDQASLDEARRSIANKDTVTFVHEDAIHFLKNFKKPIDFLYLDSFDFDYRAPHLSQEHHLKEIEAAYNQLSPQAIVMIDDCALPYGGKGRLVIKYLLSKGWKKEIDAYQVIMTRS